MSFERYPTAVATTTTDTPIVIEPGYTRTWPQEVILRIPNTYDGAEGWSTSFIANGSGNTYAIVSARTRTGPGSQPVIYASTFGNPLTSVNPTPSLLAYRTVRGLMPGRQYRLDATIGVGPGLTISERARIRMGGQSSAWVTGADFLARSVTFTATGDEEDLVLEVADDPALTGASVLASMDAANITVTALPYVETVPPVLDDQINLPIYSGDLTADSGWAPYVQGSVTVPFASEALGAALDPNDGSRFKITASSIRDYVAQWTPWTIQRRNLHPDPGHAASITELPDGKGTLRSYFTPITSSVYGDTGYLNNFATGNLADRLQAVHARKLAAGAHIGWYFNINYNLSTATKTRLHLDLGTLSVVATAPKPSTLVAVVQVLKGFTVVYERTVPISTLTENIVTTTTIDQVINEAPHGLQVRVLIENRGTAAWQTFLTWQSFSARVAANVFAVMDGDQAALPIISETATIPPAETDTRRYRRVPPLGTGPSYVEETRQAAAPIIGIVDEREFDLALASREINYERGEMTLTLATDEYLLQRFGKPADDKTPRTREHSLRSVIEYVAGEALGVVPPLAGSVDADVTARWAITNQITNPRLVTNADSWLTGSGASAGTRVVMSGPLPPVGNTAYGWTAAAGQSNAVPITTRYRVEPGRFYVFTAYICSAVTRQARAAIQWWSAGGALSATSYGVLISSNVGSFQRVFVIAQCPPGAEEAVPYVNVLGNAAGNQHYATMGMFYEGDELVDYFDGATGTTGGYTHAWQAVAHGSTSTRTPVIPRPVEALTWAAGQTAWDFLAPLVTGAGLRLFCDESRTWRLNPTTYTAPGSLTVTPATTVEGKDTIDGERGEYADGVVIQWAWTDDNGVERMTTETAGTEGKVTTVEMKAPYPGKGTAAAHLAQLQKRASIRPVTVATDYRATPDQPLSLTMPDAEAATGELASVKWDLTTGLMQLEPTALEAS